MNDFREDLTYGADLLKNLIEEYENEVKADTSWPTLVVHSDIRKQVWSICDSVGHSARGVPATACRLLERFLSCSSKIYLKDQRDVAGWSRYKITLGSQLYLIIVASIQLVAKMSDRVSYVPASLMRSVLVKAGIQHSKAEILAMEIHVYKTLDYRLPTWTTLEIAEFLATVVGLGEDPKVKLSLAPIMDMTEYHRNVLEYHMKAWDEACNTPGSSSSKAASGSVQNLAMCAGVVSATVRHSPASARDPTERLAARLKLDVAYVTAVADVILKHILPDKKSRPLKRKRNR